MTTKTYGCVFLLLFIGVATMMSSARAEYYCGRANSCYMVPSNCTYGDCDFEVVWNLNENGTRFNFKIAARHDGWVAVAFSDDQKMGNDDVLMCLADGQSATFMHRYNEGRSNIAATPMDGIKVTELRNVEGVVSCRVERDISLINNNNMFDLDQDWYMFFGQGPLSNNGGPIQHIELPKITKNKVDISVITVLSQMDLEGYKPDGDGATTQQAGLLLVLCNAILVLIGVHL